MNDSFTFMVNPSENNRVHAITEALDPAPERVVVSTFLPQHWQQIVGLYQEVFGPPATYDFVRRWRWSQEESLLPDKACRWVLLHGSRVVGFLGTVPLPYQVLGQEVIAHTPCDYMVHPRYRFHGLKLMRQFFRECPNCVTCDNMPSTIRVTEWLGAQAAGTMRRYVKVLDARALGAHSDFSHIPRVLLRSLNPLLSCWDAFSQLRLPHHLFIEPLQDFDDRFQVFFQRLEGQSLATVVRNLAYMRWRYGPDSPHARRAIAAAVDGKGDLHGYIVYHLSEKTPKTAYVLDFQVLGADREQTARALLGYAVKKARRARAWEMRFYLLPSASNPPVAALSGWGFLARGRLQLLVKLSQKDLDAVATDGRNWNLSFGDSEASYAYT